MNGQPACQRSRVSYNCYWNEQGNALKPAAAGRYFIIDIWQPCHIHADGGYAMPPFSGTLKQAKRVIVAVVGLTVLGIGIAMIVLPGPAIVVIPLGLGILATEFVWAKNLLHKFKERLAGRASAG